MTIALEGPRFAEAQRALARFNHDRLTPSLAPLASSFTALERDLLDLESAFVVAARERVAPSLSDVPDDPMRFVRWFERLVDDGPGQGDPLFPWLAHSASRDEMKWFLGQEVAGEAGFEDLLALTQVKMPRRAKLEMARNYWDEMGRGQAKGMHGPMLQTLADHFGLKPTPDTTVPEALALGNLMIALASNRHTAFQSIGALGVIELTAPGRAAHVVAGLRRLHVPLKASHYFSLHAVLDVQHSAAWNGEVLATLVEEDRRRARAIAEGAILRLWCGARCFERYRRHFSLGGHEKRPSGVPARADQATYHAGPAL